MKNLTKRVGLLGFAIVLCASTWADIGQMAYYSEHLDSIDRKENKQLKSALYAAIKDHTILSYKQARRHLFGEIYLEKKGSSYKVTDVYCEKDYTSSVGVGPGKIPNPNQLNCEHTWPQSRFNGRQSRSAQKSDLHHLFPTEARANSTRGNILFGEVDGNALSNCRASERGDDIYEGHDAFEPPKNHRGNVARALFYFSVRYKINIPDEEEVHLRRWHKSDPVDSKEMGRHEKIYKIQGNRNPFIDDPDLADRISNF